MKMECQQQQGGSRLTLEETLAKQKNERKIFTKKRKIFKRS